MEIMFKIRKFYLEFYSAHDHFRYQTELSKSDFAHNTEFSFHPIYLSALSSSASNLCVHTLFYKHTACNGYSLLIQMCHCDFLPENILKGPPSKLATEPSSYSSYYYFAFPSNRSPLQSFLRSSKHSRASKLMPTQVPSYLQPELARILN